VIAGILGRYVGRAVLAAVLIVAVLLVGLYTIIELVRESRDLTGDYGVVEMLVYLAQTTPSRLYDIFPFAVLIGTLLGLGGLAATRELVAMRAAGFDRRQILISVLAAVGLCLAVLFVVSETLLPQLEARASAERDQARSGQVRLGRYGALWLRDGHLMLRIDYSSWSARETPEFSQLLIYRLDDAMRPLQILTAGTASHDGSRWRLSNVAARTIDGSEPPEEHAQLVLESTLSYDLFSSAVTRPRMLAIADLIDMIKLLGANELNTEPYRQALWNRLFYPLNVLAMILISLPFAFGGARHGGRGLSLLAGVSLGLMFFVVSRLVRGAALLWPGPLWLLMLMPALLFGLLGLVLLRRL